MVAWFVIAIGTIGLLAFIAMNGVSTVDTLGESSARIQTVQRMDKLAAAIMQRAASADMDGALYLPAGSPGATSTTPYKLPADIAALGQTPYGAQIFYCPFGGTGAGSTTTQSVYTSGASYSVGVRSSNGRNYVVSGRPNYANVAADQNLMGFLIAPANRASPASGCSSVTYSNGSYTAPNSIVRPLTREIAADAGRRDVGSGATYYVSPTGTGSGLTPSAPASLSAALQKYRTTATTGLTLLLGSGTYSVASSDFDSGSGFNRQAQSTLTIASYSGSRDVTLNAAANTVIRPSYNLTLQGVLTSAGFTAARGTTLRLINTATGTVNASSSSSIYVSGNSAISTTATSAIAATGSSKVSITGSLTVFYTAGTDAVIATTGSSILVKNAFLTFSPSVEGGKVRYGLLPDASSRLSIADSTISFTGPVAVAIGAAGDTVVSRSTLYTGVGGDALIEGSNNASLNIASSAIGSGSPTTYGIIDNGLRALSGTSALRAAGACWTFSSPSSILALSPAGSNGASSTVAQDVSPEGILPVATPPTSDQVKTYQAIVWSNEQKAANRRSNSSQFSCQIG